MNRRMSNASAWRVSSGVPHICPERPRALRRHARQDRPGNPGLAGVTQVSMNMPRIQSTGPQTFSDIRKGFAAVEGHRHIRFTDAQGLHAHSRINASGLDFLAAFRNEQALDLRSTMRRLAVEEIKKSIDYEFGPGMGERAFTLASNGKPTTELTKDGLRHLDSAIEQLQAQDQALANTRFGENSGWTIDAVFDEAVKELHNSQEMPAPTMNELKTRMTRAVTDQPPGATPLQCLRAARLVVLEHDLRSRFAAEEGSPEAKQLAAHLENLRPGGSLRHIPLEDARKMLKDWCRGNGYFPPDAEKLLRDLDSRWAPSTTLSAHRPGRNPPVGNQPDAQQAVQPAIAQSQSWQRARPRPTGGVGSETPANPTAAAENSGNPAIEPHAPAAAKVGKSTSGATLTRRRSFPGEETKRPAAISVSHEAPADARVDELGQKRKRAQTHPGLGAGKSDSLEEIDQQYRKPITGAADDPRTQ